MSSYQARVRAVYPTARLQRRGRTGFSWRVVVTSKHRRPPLVLGEGHRPADAWRLAALLVDPPARRVVRAKPAGFVLEVPADHPLVVGLDLSMTADISAEALFEDGRLVSITRLERVAPARNLKG